MQTYWVVNQVEIVSKDKSCSICKSCCKKKFCYYLHFIDVSSNETIHIKTHTNCSFIFISLVLDSTVSWFSWSMNMGRYISAQRSNLSQNMKHSMLYFQKKHFAHSRWKGRLLFSDSEHYSSLSKISYEATRWMFSSLLQFSDINAKKVHQWRILH